MRTRLSTVLQKSFISAVVVVLTIIAPIPVFAEAPTSTSENTTPTTSTTPPTSEPPTPSTPASTIAPPPTGPAGPTGPEGATYTYNESTGLWENEHYTWNPANGQTTPKTPPTYSYNPNTGRWDTTEWVYTPESGNYVPNLISVTQLPPNATTTQPQPSNSPAAPTAQENNANTTFNSFYNPSISNAITQHSTTGNALVLSNTGAGDALSGNAQSIANVINLLQSTASLTGGDFATFVADINGNVQGDLLIDPNLLQSASHSDALANNTHINTSNNSAINNDITLASVSGDATVSNNTSAGNATTGEAHAVANIVNLINSIISARKSFAGVINIHGNLEGNIVVPQDFLNSIIATNNPNSTTSLTGNEDSNLVANLANSSSVTNNINAAAASGQASIDRNTKAGDAATGNAETNVTVLNLTGQKVVAENSLLVFVNVLGRWVGLIMNAPEGTTAAALSGGVISNSKDTLLTNTSSATITNNINIAAQSGDATVSNNTNAGNATSGNASASTNITNMTNSNFGLSNWFGVLFINVFGSWLGNFGTATPPTTASTTTSGSSPTSVDSINPAINDVRVFRFIPSSSDTPTVTPVELPATIASGQGGNSNDEDQALVGYLNQTPSDKDLQSNTSSAANLASHLNLIPLAIGIIGIIFLTSEQLRNLLGSNRRGNYSSRVKLWQQARNH